MGRLYLYALEVQRAKFINKLLRSRSRSNNLLEREASEAVWNTIEFICKRSSVRRARGKSQSPGNAGKIGGDRAKATRPESAHKACQCGIECGILPQ